MLNSPEELRTKLITLFPHAEKELVDDSDDDFDYGYKPPLTYHSVWRTFAPMAYQCLSNASVKEQKMFCNLIDWMVQAGGDEENAVSTCLLEHASQIGIKNLIKAYLSKTAGDAVK